MEHTYTGIAGAAHDNLSKRVKNKAGTKSYIRNEAKAKRLSSVMTAEDKEAAALKAIMEIVR